MMGKLLRQEFLTTRKALVSITGWLFLVGIVGLVPIAIPIPYVSQLGNVMALACFVLLVPILLAYLAYSYWQSMYGRRGYFTMTLPVRGRLIYWAKVCYALLVACVGVVLSVGGLVLGTLATDLGARREFGSALGDIWGAVTSLYGSAAWPLVVIVVVQGVLFTLAIPAMISVSAQARYNHLGVGAPVIGGVLSYLVYQVTSLVAMMFIPFGIILEGPGAGSFVAQGMWQEIVDIVSDPNADPGAMPYVLGLGMLITATALTAWVVWCGIRSIERRTSLR